MTKNPKIQAPKAVDASKKATSAKHPDAIVNAQSTRVPIKKAASVEKSAKLPNHTSVHEIATSITRLNHYGMTERNEPAGIKTEVYKPKSHAQKIAGLDTHIPAEKESHTVSTDAKTGVHKPDSHAQKIAGHDTHTQAEKESHTVATDMTARVHAASPGAKPEAHTMLSEMKKSDQVEKNEAKIASMASHSHAGTASHKISYDAKTGGHQAEPDNAKAAAHNPYNQVTGLNHVSFDTRNSVHKAGEEETVSNSHIIPKHEGMKAQTVSGHGKPRGNMNIPAAKFPAAQGHISS